MCNLSTAPVLKAPHHCGHEEITKLAQAATPGLPNLQNNCSSEINVENHSCFAMVEEHKSLEVIFSKYFPLLKKKSNIIIFLIKFKIFIIIYNKGRSISMNTTMVYQSKIFKFKIYKHKIYIINKRFLNFKSLIINNSLGWVRHHYYLHLLHKENISISTFLKKVQYCVIQESLALYYFQFQLSLAQTENPLPSFELFLSMRGNENSSFFFPWVMGDVGTCQVGASNTPAWARPWSSRA